MMRHNNRSIPGLLAISLMCSTGIAFAQNRNMDANARSGEEAAQHLQTEAEGKQYAANRAQLKTNENETGEEPSYDGWKTQRNGSRAHQILDTRRHLSDMSVEVIDARMNLSSAQKRQIQAILDRKNEQYQALKLSPQQQTDPAAATALGKQRAEISRKASRDIAMTLTREQQNQIAGLMTEQTEKALARGEQSDSDARLTRNQSSGKEMQSRRFHLHRRYRSSQSAYPSEKP